MKSTLIYISLILLTILSWYIMTRISSYQAIPATFMCIFIVAFLIKAIQDVLDYSD